MTASEIRKQIRKLIQKMKYVDDEDFTIGTQKKLMVLREQLSNITGRKFSKVSYKWLTAEEQSKL